MGSPMPATAASAARPGIVAAPRDLDSLRDQSAVDTGERHHIADRAERHQIEPLQEVRLGSAGTVPAGPAQLAIDRDDQQKGDADRRQRAVRAALVEPVRVDDRDGPRQQRLGDVMIDDDHLEPGLRGVRQRQMRRRAAIDGDDDPHALVAQAQQSRGVRAVALAQPVRDIDPGSRPDRRKEPRQQRRRGRAVDIVIAKDADRLAVVHRADEPRHGSIHVAQMRGIGQLVAQARRQEARRVVEIDAALRQQPPDDLGNPEPLGDRLSRSASPSREPPATAAHRPLDPQHHPGKGVGAPRAVIHI